jgi:hypothetical protein
MGTKSATTSIKELEGILNRYTDRLLASAEKRSTKLAGLIQEHENSPAISKHKLHTLNLLKRSMDVTAQLVRAKAVSSIISAYSAYKDEEHTGELLTPNQVVFFFQRQKDREPQFAKEIAIYFSKHFGTLAPMQILERDRMDFTPIVFGDNEVVLAEEVMALDYAFEYADISMLCVDDLLGCIRVSNKVDTAIYTDSEWERFSELMDEYDVNGVLYRWSISEDESNDWQPTPDEPVVCENKEVDFFPFIKPAYLGEENWARFMDFLIQKGFIEDDPDLKKLFFYRFTGCPASKPTDLQKKITWRINCSRATKVHPGELLSILFLMSCYGKFPENSAYIAKFFDFALITPNGVVEPINYTFPQYLQRYVSKGDTVQTRIREIWEVVE